MKVLLVSTSRADMGSLEPVYQALKAKGVDAEFQQFKFDPPEYKSGVVSNYREASYDAETEIYTHQPDLVVLCGDRYETLAAATTAFLMQVPIAHLSGGDVTEGSQDDCMRHAITKLSQLHFVTSYKSYCRVTQLGEDGNLVYNVGCPTSEIKDVLPLEEVNIKLNLDLKEQDYLLVVWHPNTLSTPEDVLKETQILGTALDKIDKRIVIIGPNNDVGNTEIREFFKAWAVKGDVYLDQVSREIYLSLLKHAACLVGNSSSAFYEAPYVGTPVVNVGDRQEGRFLENETAIHSSINVVDIVNCINGIFELDRSEIEVKIALEAAKTIADVISKLENPKSLLKKVFHDV